jgi:hypothetical protein
MDSFHHSNLDSTSNFFVIYIVIANYAGIIAKRSNCSNINQRSLRMLVKFYMAADTLHPTDG